MTKRIFFYFYSSRHCVSFTNTVVLAAFENKENVLKVNWSDFHLSSLGGVVESFPVTPVDSISV